MTTSLYELARLIAGRVSSVQTDESDDAETILGLVQDYGCDPDYVDYIAELAEYYL